MSTLLLIKSLFAACWISTYFHHVAGVLLATKNVGDIGYFDADKKWNPLHEKKKAIYVYSSADDGLWIINKFNSVSKKNETSDKWISMRKSFVSLTCNYRDSIFGVDGKGHVFQCLKQCDNAKKWTKFASPEMVAIEDGNAEYSLKIREKLKMQQLYSGKLIQLISSKDRLFGRDEIGNLWKYMTDTAQWIKIGLTFDVKWIDVNGDNVLFVINDEDNKPYKIELGAGNSDDMYELIDDANDFEQIVYDDQKKLIWALNYYQQLFYFEQENKDWKYVTENIHFISSGQVRPAFASKTEL